MTIALDGFQYGFDTGNLIHGVVTAPEFELKRDVQTFWGVLGASVNYSRQETRILTLPVTILNLASQSNLTAHVATIRSHVNDNGTLTVDSIAWPSSAFIGFFPSGPQMFDSSGQHGWLQQGEFRFLQIAF